jgi:tungstate transport system substrate-binding protein
MMHEIRKISMLLAALAIACIAFGAADEDRLKIATTSSLYDTGLLEKIVDEFSAENNSTVQIPSHGGTGIAIAAGQKGDVDLLIIHDKIREVKFIDDEDGLERRCIAYNYFYIVGPEDDPAGIVGLNASEAFKRIIKSGLSDPDQVKFITRGDQSGTHAKEQLIWKMAGYNYSDVNTSGPWYVDAGSPMGATLIMANEKSAYTLTDMSTFMAFKGNLTLVPLIEGGDELLNVYTAIAVNPAKHPGVNCALANDFIDYLVSDECQEIIGTYGQDLYGQPLFFKGKGNCDIMGCSAEECVVPTRAGCAAA